MWATGEVLTVGSTINEITDGERAYMVIARVISGVTYAYLLGMLQPAATLSGGPLRLFPLHTTGFTHPPAQQLEWHCLPLSDFSQHAHI